MSVKEQKKISFINDCNCCVDLDELEKAILWFAEKPTESVKRIYMHGKYPAVSIFEKKIHVHRLLMMFWNNSKKMPKDIYVHHKDGNKLNANRENLMFINRSEHQSFHNKGKVLSLNQRMIIAENNRRRKGMKIGITKKGITYEKIWSLHLKGYSINKISKFLDYDWKQVKTRINEIYENPELLEEL